jgi:hypothetical protein
MQPNNMFTYALRLAFFLILYGAFASVTYAETKDTEEEKEETAQALFDEAVAKRDSGKIFESIKLFKTILSTRPQLGRECQAGYPRLPGAT